MPDRILGYVVGRNYLDADGVRRAPLVAVVMHDGEPTWLAPHVFFDCCVEPPCVEPSEITKARATLPAHRDTDRDWFAVEAGRE